jgi:hypothetical protein
MPQRLVQYGFALVAPSVLLQGCAAILGSKSTNVAAVSDPPGAEVYLDGARVGVTPDTLAVESKKTHTIVLKKAGYKEDSCTLPSSVDGGWVILDVLLSGLIGVIVDAATNEWNELTKKSCKVVLTPSASGPGPTVADAAPTSNEPAIAQAPQASESFRSSAPNENVSDRIRADRRSIVSDIIRTDLAVSVEQGPPGILRVGIGRRFQEHQARQYYLEQLTGAYSSWAVESHPLIIEIWDGNAKIGEFTEGALLLGPGYNTPLDCPENAAIGLCSTLGQAAPSHDAQVTPPSDSPATPTIDAPTVANRYQPDDSANPRPGFQIGLGLGAGLFDVICDGCDAPSETGFSGFLSLSGRVGEKTYVGVETTGWTKDVEDVSSQAYSLMAHVTEFVGDENGLFMRAGLGVVGFRDEDDFTANAVGFLGRIGYEFGSAGIVVAPYVGLVRTFGGAEVKLDGEEIGFDFAISNVQFGLSIFNR